MPLDEIDVDQLSVSQRLELIPGVRLNKPIPVTIRSDGDGFIASFLDANISTGADTIPEAIADLQSLIVDVFDSFDGVLDSQLGPDMVRQKHVLTEVLCRTS